MTIPAPGNPFEIIPTPDGPWYRVLAHIDDQVPQMPIWDQDRISTYIAIAEGFEGHGQMLVRINGVLWNPPIGSVIQVSEPNRDVTVHHVHFHVDLAGLTCGVFVTDSGIR